MTNLEIEKTLGAIIAQYGLETTQVLLWLSEAMNNCVAQIKEAGPCGLTEVEMTIKSPAQRSAMLDSLVELGALSRNGDCYCFVSAIGDLAAVKKDWRKPFAVFGKALARHCGVSWRGEPASAVNRLSLN